MTPAECLPSPLPLRRAVEDHYADRMPLFSDTEGPVPGWAAPASASQVMDELIAAARAGNVVYLTGPGDDSEVEAAVAPVEVVKAGLAALGRTEGGDSA